MANNRVFGEEEQEEEIIDGFEAFINLPCGCLVSKVFPYDETLSEDENKIKIMEAIKTHIQSGNKIKHDCRGKKPEFN